MKIKRDSHVLFSSGENVGNGFESYDFRLIRLISKKSPTSEESNSSSSVALKRALPSKQLSPFLTSD